MHYILLNLFILSNSFASDKAIVIGSKIFTESYILSEIASQTIEYQSNAHVDRKFGIGNSGMLVEALGSGKIDLYSDYTGTIAETILKNSSVRTLDEIRQALEPLGYTISDSLGFNNTYALAVRESFAKKYNVRKISDLKSISAPIRAAFSYEFMDRKDGYPNLMNQYGLRLGSVIQIEHSLVYQAISENAVDMIEVYATDANVKKFNLVILEDDLKAFPDYTAVWIARTEFVKAHEPLWRDLSRLSGKISVQQMQAMNEQADLQKENFSDIAAKFLNRPPKKTVSMVDQVWLRTKEHLFLVSFALLFSVIIGIPIGIFAATYEKVGQTILVLSAVIQTIPTLALLCFLIPFFGIGLKPAIVALCLYSLLPVVLNTFTGIRSVDSRHIENAKAFGLTNAQILFKITLPLSSLMILAGLKTATIVTIGTATLAALIGAGGYGTLIVSGLSLNDIPTILAGAVPAAAMAFMVHVLFEIVTRTFIPKGWRIQNVA